MTVNERSGAKSRAAGQYIEQVMRDMGVSQAELARQINRDTSGVGRMLAGEAGITRDVFNSIVRALKPTIVPQKLIQLLGYNVGYEDAEDRIDADLARKLLALEPRRYQLVVQLAHELYRAQAGSE